MLNWSEAFAALRCGRDVRRDSWTRTEFLRVVGKRLVKIVVSRRSTFTSSYTVNDEDLFANDWIIA